MAVILGAAHIDERGKASGGKAGDQTGKEVCTRPYYVHSKGWRVFRPVDPEAAKKIAKNAQAACDNPKIGYDQYQRDTLYENSKPYGFDASKVKTASETDCSALVRVCCGYAGIKLPNFNTSNEASVLLASKAFKELTGSKYQNQSTYLRKGDILVTKTKGHTEIVLSNGSKAEPLPMTNPTEVVVTGGLVNVRKGPGTEYGVLGVAKKGDTFKYGGKTWENGWHLIEYKKQNAAISGRYTKLAGGK